ncbi:MAG: DUF3011 domain-containing protein [Desulforhopalus sp.]
MHKLLFFRSISILLCGILLQGSTVFAREIVHCKSNDFKYRYCRVATGNHVSLDRQLSTTRCRYGKNWGYDRHGIWVDRGCEANFRVGGHYRHDDYNRHGNRDRDWNYDHDNHDENKDNALAVGAAIAGIGLIAALAANSQHKQVDVSSWAVGTFRGYDDYEHTSVELTILPGGSVSGFAGNNQFSGSLEGTRLQAGKHRFTISRSGNGFLATDEENSHHRVMFQRSGSGY